MKWHALLLSLSVGCALSTAHAVQPQTSSGVGKSLQRPGPAANAPVYIVTSRESYDRSGLKSFLTGPTSHRDSTGNELVLAETRADQLPKLSETIHETERRCGGYFAFATKDEAMEFLRSDRSLQAMNAAAAIAYTIDNQATVTPWLSQVGEPNIRSTISYLSTTYTNRYYTTTKGKNAALWIRDTWQGLINGRSDASVALFTGCTDCSTQPSVILTITGTELPNEIVVLGGHLDSISSTGSGENMNAPGADDDASGIAVLTEVLRVAMASGYKPKRTVQFMAYAAEEVGLRGSKAVANSYKTNGKNVVGMLQLDMTDYNKAGGYDIHVVTDYSSATLVQFLKDLFNAYMGSSGLTLGTEACGYACSDHASWTNAGYPAARYVEGPRTPNMHTPNDTLANLGNSAAHAANTAKLSLAFLGELGKTSGGNSPPTANFTFTINNLAATFTDASSDSDGSIASRSWNFGDGTTSTDVNPSKTYAADGTYTVTLTVTDDDGASTGTSKQVTVGAVQPSYFENATDYTINDNATVESPIAVSRTGNAPSTLAVAVNIVHTYIGDLKVDLVAPDGSVYNLHNRSGGSTDNINKTYTVNASSEAANGTWKLRVNDNAAQDVGKIDKWSLQF